jgi:hypothetical protein
MNYKDTEPCMSDFLSVDLLTDFAAFYSTDFIDWRYIHSWLVFSTQLVNYCPHGRRNYTCVLLPLYILSDLLPPSQTKCTVYTDSVCLGGGVLNCTVDHIPQEFYTLFLTRFRTYKIASPPQTKMTSKDDSSVADPDPESGIGCLFDPWIRDGRKSASGSGIQDEQPGSYFLELRNQFFCFFWG